jgi:hypothetical protein
VSAVSAEVASAALAPLSEAMRADGYALSVAEADDDIEITVTATEGACGECLVPKAIFKAMAVQTLQDQGLTLPGDVRVVYPPEHHDS